MKAFIAAIGTAAMLVTGIAASVAPAAAGDRYYRDYRGHHDNGWRGHRGGWRGDRGWRGRHRGNDGDALAAGVIGLGVGAIIGGALADSGRPTYYEDGPRYRGYDRGYYGRPILEGPVYGGRVIEVERPVRYYREVPPVYRSGYSHVAACEARYRSYDRRTDTFVGYDGRVHRCNL